MEALPPSLPNAGLQPPAPAGQAGLAILLADLSAALAQTLAKLPANTPLTALVTQILPASLPADPGASKQPSGLLVQVSTPDGLAQIRLPAQVPVTPGAKLDIVVLQAGGAQPQARLLAVNGQPVTQAVSAAPQSVSASAPPPTIAAPSAATVQSAPKPLPSPGIPATLVTSSNPALPSGTTLLVRITGLTPPPLQQQPEVEPAPPAQTPTYAAPPTPAAAPVAGPVIPAAAPEPETKEASEAPPTPPPDARTAPLPVPSPASAPSSALSSAGAAAPIQTTTNSPAPASVAPALATAAPAPAPPPAQTQVSDPAPAPILAPAPAPMANAAAPLPQAQGPTPSVQIPSPAPVPAPAPAPLPSEVSGLVLTNTDAGKPLLRTPIGLLALDTPPQTLPPDTEVTLQLVGKPVPPPAVPPAPPGPDDPPERILPKRLAQLVETAQTSPGGDALAAAVRDKIPAPGPKLAAQLLSAMTTADQPQGLVKFLGDGLASALSHAAPQALDSLARHWEAASTQVQGPAEGDWRSLMIPFMMGGEITNLRLTLRQRQGKMAAAEREKGTRFLLDLDLSRLGPLQLDGLVKRQHKRFDLIIRTETALSGEMRRDIDALFVNGLLNFGLEGSIAFQPDGRFIVTPRLTGDSNGIIFA